MKNNEFLWCCGIEDTFISDPHPITGKTLDEYELTGHYDLWRQDFDKVKSLGVDALRWGIPWYRVQPKKNTWDWSWTDKAISYLVEDLKVDLNLDLMHYGTPGWLEGAFVHPDYPQAVEEYTAQVIERYGHLLHMATPFNEPHTAAEFAGRRGEWPPYLHGYTGYLSVYKNIMKGTLRQTKLLQNANITCIQVECSGGSFTKIPALQKMASVETVVQSMFFDFLTGDLSGLEPFFPFLEEHGFTEQDFSYFSQQGTGIDVMGVNFYPQFSFQNLSYDKKGDIQRDNIHLWTEDLIRILHSRYEKYQCPMIVTETSVRDDVAMKSRWLEEASKAVYSEFISGLPVFGFTWFPIIDMYDWDYRVNVGDKSKFKACFGFWNQEREEYCCAQQYRSIIKSAKELNR
ncbi:MAG: family 1 glycosylhydrolase [Sphaerochaeta sp.]|nr:family 1 glycosylhydrolase [Sphaerochaeta sp.]